MTKTLTDGKKHAAVVGFGVEGHSAAAFLLAHGYKVTVFDEKKSREKAASSFGPLKEQGASYVHAPFSDFAGFTLIVVSPGVRIDRPAILEAKRRGSEVTTATNIFMDRVPCPVIGVTGTKGKGTTSALITEMHKAAGRDAHLGGNIGTPPLDFLEKLTPESVVVLELSSFQLMTIRKSPHIAVILMVTSEHLDYHRDTDEYVDAKAGIVRFQGSDDYTVVNIDYPNSVAVSGLSGNTPIEVSTRDQVDYGCYATQSDIIWAEHGDIVKVAKVSDIFIPGRHNWENVCAAVAVAKLSGISNKAIRKVIQEFRGLPHRIEFVREAGGVRYYDDSFSTTPETAVAAIHAFDQPKVIVLGGSGKGSDFTELGKTIAQSDSIRAVIGIGAEWPRIKMKIAHPAQEVTVIEGCRTMPEIVDAARSVSEPGDVVIMSPACASFDMFKNYKDRGDQFKSAVRELTHNKNTKDNQNL
jgi:UDP-N-acetylmuramoylalanine--D-glutamate ligase